MILPVPAAPYMSQAPMTYCYKVVNAEDGTYDTKLVNVCKALYNYWEEADKYSKLP